MLFVKRQLYNIKISISYLRQKSSRFTLRIGSTFCAYLFVSIYIKLMGIVVLFKNILHRHFWNVFIIMGRRVYPLKHLKYTLENILIIVWPKFPLYHRTYYSIKHLFIHESNCNLIKLVQMYYKFIQIILLLNPSYVNAVTKWYNVLFFTR